MPIELDREIKLYHLAPLVSAAIVIAMYLGRSDTFQNTLFLLNLLALPFLTGIMYVDSLDRSDQPTWGRVIMGPWVVVLFILLVDLLLGSFYFVIVAPILLLMASLGAVITRCVTMKR